MQARVILGAVCTTVLLATTVAAAAAPGPRVQIAGLNFEIVLPTGWTGASIPQHPTAATIKSLNPDHPNIAALLQSPVARLFSFRFVANPPVVRGTFTPNLNVIIQTIPNGESLRGWFFSGSSAAAQYVGTTRNIRLASLPGIHYWSTKIQKAGTTPLLTDTFVLERGRQAYEFTFTSLASDAPKLRPLFDASGSSITSG